MSAAKVPARRSTPQRSWRQDSAYELGLADPVPSVPARRHHVVHVPFLQQANPQTQETPPDDRKVTRRRFRRSETVFSDHSWFIEGVPHVRNQMS